jgi:hypothetical protein
MGSTVELVDADADAADMDTDVPDVDVGGASGDTSCGGVESASVSP